MKTEIARQLVAKDAWLRDVPEFLLILHYHRFYWKTYSDNLIGADRRFFRPGDQVRLDNKLRIMREQCKIDLLGAGIEPTDAESLLKWIDASKFDWDTYAAEAKQAGALA